MEGLRPHRKPRATEKALCSCQCVNYHYQAFTLSLWPVSMLLLIKNKCPVKKETACLNFHFFSNGLSLTSATPTNERISQGIRRVSLSHHPHPVNDVTTSSHVKYRLHGLSAHFWDSLTKYINNQWKTAPPREPFSYFLWGWLTLKRYSRTGMGSLTLCQVQVCVETPSWWDQTSYPGVPTPHREALYHDKIISDVTALLSTDYEPMPR